MHTMWMNGRMVDPSEARVSVLDHGLLYGDGIFEGIRFYAKRPFRLDAHLARLERSAAAIRLALPYPREDFAAAVGAVVGASPLPDGYLRVLVTRGDGELGLDPRSCARPNAFVIAAPLRIFGEGALAGVDVVIAATRQAALDSLDPRIKSLNYLNRILAKLEATDAGAAEAIMLNAAGRIAEGSADNVFLVRDGVLLTPAASDGALEGVTRDVVLGIARGLGVTTKEASLGVYDLVAADEAFLTGTGAELVPVRRVNGRALASCPGPVFTLLRDGFTAAVRSET